MNKMNASMKIISLLLLSLLFWGNYVNGQNLQNAFDKIADIEGFERVDYTAEEYGYPKEIGSMKMVGYGNADPRDKVLVILSKIPSKLLVAEENIRGEMCRWYIEDLKNGSTVMMCIFVGTGSADTVAQLFTGSSRTYYHKFAKKIEEEFKK